MSQLRVSKPQDMEVLKLSGDFVQRLLESCDHLRPEHRKSVKLPPAQQYDALLMASLLNDHGLACEIKVLAAKGLK